MEFLLVIALSLFVNIALILDKFKGKKDKKTGKRKVTLAGILNGLIDSSLTILVVVVFNGSFNALAVGSLGSALVSLYLWLFPFFKEQEA